MENIYIILFQFIDYMALAGFYFVTKNASEPCLHILQLEGYESADYLKWLKENRSLLGKKLSQEKTPLVWTDRAKRLFGVHSSILLVIGLILSISSLIFSKIIGYEIATAAYLVGLFIAYNLRAYIMVLANKINKPREEKINMGFYNMALEKIKSRKKSGLVVVGITGSYGKTSTKFMLQTILSEKLKTMTTPSSFNTPMGLSKVINNDLTDDIEVFVAELGAKKIGEIKEVADLVQPEIGILTAIGPTHMHMFKTIENIQKTKYELIEALPKNGLGIFNYDNEYVKPLADREDVRVFRYGLENNEKLALFAKDIEVFERGSKFKLVWKDKEMACSTKVLGKHNISNILAAASCALNLGLSLEEIKNGIEKIEPVEHRLSLVENESQIVIIDDAFNSNPVGARAALDVLSNFKEGRKIVITPGMVELGDMEEEENKIFGKELARVCDFIILVGKKRTLPIQEGIREENFKEENLFVAGSLNEATQILGHLTRPGDVVLFENDLPDSYSEE
ncbi:UDP-N-acetylmuramoyl-tripeptide--D-alanyl-D-alanine ligase [Clostridiales bacterium KA00134]|nr:UDP-N-acetylmuramoyl-tripeptide--D-alanyl-D-alanine ligase [Clostridiales bacterium KA00134]